MSISFAGAKLKNRLVASSSPLTESLPRLLRCREAGFGAAILKSAADYAKTGTGHGRKVVYIGDDYYADASFEREILTAEEGLALFRGAAALSGDMLLIPSVSASSLEPDEWYSVCRPFQDEGAVLIQLDFFYLGTLLHNSGFYQKLHRMLAVLNGQLNCVVMPKLNPNFDPDTVCALLADAGVQYVSLLDSMRQDLPPEYGLHQGTTSYFGGKQLPVTLGYLGAAVRHGLAACAGGGVTSPQDVKLLRGKGAELVQVASYILKDGFSKVTELLPSVSGAALPGAALNSPFLEHNPWCDVEDGAVCEQCGACCRNGISCAVGYGHQKTVHRKETSTVH